MSDGEDGYAPLLRNAVTPGYPYAPPDSSHPSCTSENKEPAAKPRRVGLLPLIGITYFLVCGGAYGTEDLARYAHRRGSRRRLMHLRAALAAPYRRRTRFWASCWCRGCGA